MNFVTIITSLGSGGIKASFINHLLNKNKELNIQLNQINEEKYRTLLIHMSCVLDIKNRKYFIIKKDCKEDDQNYYFNCVKEYYYHSLLYSPDFIIMGLKKFIENPNKEFFVEFAKSMRKDLWGKKTKLEAKDLLLRNKNNKIWGNTGMI